MSGRGEKRMVRRFSDVVMATLDTTMCLMLWAVIIGSVVGCAAIKANPSMVNTLATDVGYAGYRLAPEAREALSLFCLLADADNPLVIQKAINEALGQIWLKANSTDAQLLVLSINNLVGFAGLQDKVTPEKAKVWKDVAKAICKGVALAQGSK
jgi:hypothetical protein